MQPQRQPLEPYVTAGLICSLGLAAWLRFEAGSLVMSWSVVVVSLAGAAVGWFVAARRLPPLELPREVEDLARDELTPAEEQRFADVLRAWHAANQQRAWCEVVRGGVGPLIRRRATVYFLWLCLVVVIVMPPMTGPSTVVPGVPRTVTILGALAVVSLAIAAPLARRDWKRAREALGQADR